MTEKKSSKALIGIVGILATFFIGGITLLTQLPNNPIWGIFITSTSVLVLILLLLNERMNYIFQQQNKSIDLLFQEQNETTNTIYNQLTNVSGKLVEKIDKTGEQIQQYTDQLEQIADIVNVPNDARFIPKGFIGLQRQSIELERDPSSGPENVRMAILGHLPSYMRRTPLTKATGELLYYNWEPPHYIPEYVKLVNQRAEAFMQFAEAGGFIRDIFSKESITHYVNEGFTFHDRVVDPPEEIEERLRALEFMIEHFDNYYVSLVDIPSDSLGHHFLLKSNVGLVLDLRTSDIERHFTNSLEGLSTQSKSVLNQFERRFSSVFIQTDKNEALEFVRNLIVKIRTPGNTNKLSAP